MRGAAVNLFPATTIALDRTMTARFMGVLRAPMACVGRFAIEPGADAGGFVTRVQDLRGRMGVRYEPLPGTWASVVASGAEENEDGLELHIGLDRVFGKSMMRSHRALQSRAEALVDPLTIRCLGLGYFSFVGVG
jgi:hypothetical protein